MWPEESTVNVEPVLLKLPPWTATVVVMAFVVLMVPKPLAIEPEVSAPTCVRFV